MSILKDLTNKLILVILKWKILSDKISFSKYKNIIAPLLSFEGGGGITPNIVLSEHDTKRNVTPQTMTNNEVDYVHWDDPNKLVDCL